MPRIGIFLADGFEEVEAITPFDYLKRAGVDVTLIGVNTEDPIGSHGLKVSVDELAEEVQPLPDGVVLPGGMPGAANLAASAEVAHITREVMRAKGLVASICAAPALALGSFGILSGRRFTCFPGMERQVSDGLFQSGRVVVDGNLITSRAAGTAGEFSIEIIRYLLGDIEANEVVKSVLLHLHDG